MAFKDTINQVRELLIELSQDLEKAARGNRTAAQRVRTGSIKLTKVAKVFRKESIEAEKGIKKGKKTVTKLSRKKKRPV